MSSTVHDLLQRHRLTVTDYEQMGVAGILAEDARVELIEGEIIDMAPIDSPHAGTIRFLTQFLVNAAAGHAQVSVQNPIILDDYSAPEPDIALLHPRDDFYKASHPYPADVLLIVEVAESSLNYDRRIKVPLYARAGIPEVWLVDLEHRQLSIFRKPGATVIRKSSARQSWPSLHPPNCPVARWILWDYSNNSSSTVLAKGTRPSQYESALFASCASNRD